MDANSFVDRSLSRRQWMWTLSALGVHAASSMSTKARAEERRWPDQRMVGPFLCHADFSLSPHLPLLEEMSLLQSELTETLQVSPARELVHLYVFSNKRLHQGYLRTYFPQAPYRRAIFIKERGPGMVFAYRHEEMATDLRHEATHALLHASLPMVPLWLDEGLAEYFEAPSRKRSKGHAHLGKVRWEARLGLLPKMQALEEITALEEMGRGEYRHSWAWVHFMLHGSDVARQELLAYLADIAAHTPPGKLSVRLHRRLTSPEKQMAKHFRSWR